ncbi:histidine--tRNA ligase [Mycoplasma iguanae]|uniref:Histidine--tRNA ligase n=1 Tax=Mycoplasma iguanae TaxID=292461 RepID=A0ABY5R7I5_9MOLU|nr:histidine--tRNA ligase [Mycoplasma iguanae]UVD81471.1 histidine--tRNA ligase [Mycoplasma iguanae]
MYNKPKGTKDLYGLNGDIFNFIKNIFFNVAKKYNFKYIETPIFETAELFQRSSGEFSDIVNKEMYVFEDKSKRKLALRPEGTAPIVRAIIENKLYTNNNTIQKYFYFGPTFRYEQPQKGRQRQFYQAGIEFLAEKNAFNDVEIILFASQFLKELKINDYILKINCLGNEKTRLKYTEVLREYLTNYKDQLEEISLLRLEKNPLRILDDKIESKKDFVINAPKINEFLSPESKKYFTEITSLLEQFNISYDYDLSLVRGLDYYDELVFEFVSNSPGLGAQSTIIGGGRYNKLFASLGGPEISAIGFGSGVERMMEIINYQIISYPELNKKLDFYLAAFNEEELLSQTLLAKQLRDSNFQLEVTKNVEKVKKAFKTAQNLANFIIFKEKEQLEDFYVIKSTTTNFKQVIKLAINQHEENQQILRDIINEEK